MINMGTFIDEINGHVFTVGASSDIAECSRCQCSVGLQRFINDEGYLCIKLSNPDDLNICGVKG
jgi:hypothetical protein